jgi:hypothetical protein
MRNAKRIQQIRAEIAARVNTGVEWELSQYTTAAELQPYAAMATLEQGMAALEQDLAAAKDLTLRRSLFAGARMSLAYAMYVTSAYARECGEAIAS